MDPNPSYPSRSNKSPRFALGCGGVGVLEKTSNKISHLDVLSYYFSLTPYKFRPPFF